MYTHSCLSHHSCCHIFLAFSFFFNDTPTTEIYTLSLHDALPISSSTSPGCAAGSRRQRWPSRKASSAHDRPASRTTDRKSTRLNSRSRRDLVCRLLLEKKKKKTKHTNIITHIIYRVSETDIVVRI